MSTSNNYTANNSRIDNLIHDMIINDGLAPAITSEDKDMIEQSRSQGRTPVMAVPYGNTKKHSYFKCTACYWDNGELVMCPKCQKFKEEWDKLNNITTMENTPDLRLTKAQRVQELFGCVIYLFGIIAAFVLLIWSTM